LTQRLFGRGHAGGTKLERKIAVPGAAARSTISLEGSQYRAVVHSS
jgi:hypothetical protein